MKGKFKLVLAGVLALGSAAWASALNTLSDLKVNSTPSGAQVVVSGSRAPTFTVFRLADPDRLVVDMTGADASSIKGPRDGQGPIRGIVASQFSNEHSSVGRVLVTLDHASQYDVRADGNRVVISVQGSHATAVTTPPAHAPAATSVASADVTAPLHPNEPNVISSAGDERKVAHAAQHITQVRVQGGELRVVADGQIPKYEVLELSDPSRLALDVYGVALAAKLPKQSGGLFQGLRAGVHADKIRFVVDVRGDMPAHPARFSPEGLRWTMQRSAATASRAVAAAEPTTDAEFEIDGEKIALGGEAAPLTPKALAPRAPARALPGVAEVKDLTFVENALGGKIEIKLTHGVPYKIEHSDARSAVLLLDTTRLPKKLERSLDTSALETPVKMVSAFAVPGATERVRVVVAAEGELSEKMEETAPGLSWRLTVKGAKTEAVAVNQQTAGFTSEGASYLSEGAPQRTGFTGKRVSFEFKDIDIHNLLRVISEVSKRSIVVADDVSGKVTIRLRNVPWDQALELILRSKGLGKEEIGNIIRVAPLGTLEKEASQRAARKLALQKQEDMVVQLIPVNYAKAEDLRERVKDILSERGNVTVDSRTNVLIIRDISSSIGKARSLVQNLDTQTPQVLIESRIVEANTTFSRQIGVQWGGNTQAAPGTNNATGLTFPNTVRVTGASDIGTASATGVSSTPNFAVNLPAAVGSGSGGALGFVFGSAGGALALNLRLSALENTGDVKTISAPKVTTLDNVSARISQGLSIPFSQVSAQGVNTIFVEARLQLEVTPHITQDGSVLMHIHAENSQPDPSLTGANGQPSIQRKEAQTQVLVKDGDTTVIGGIYVRRGASNTAMVPFLGRIPILGFFFRTDTQSDDRQELLIFITPRILNRQVVAQGNL